MKIAFEVALPDKDLHVVGSTAGRSLVGYAGRDLKRFYPIILGLEFLTKVNVWQLQRLALQGKRVAPLYQSGVFYQQEPMDREAWLDIPTLYKQGHGDCEDLACARAAEYQYAGIPAVPAIRYKQISGPQGPITLVHVLVLLPNGQEEDPSKLLGMKGEY